MAAGVVEKVLREQRKEKREQRTENREQRTENREQRAEKREQRKENSCDLGSSGEEKGRLRALFRYRFIQHGSSGVMRQGHQAGIEQQLRKPVEGPREPVGDGAQGCSQHLRGLEVGVILQHDAAEELTVEST